MITSERRRELKKLFAAESGVPWKEDWRNNLTIEEQLLIDKWDKRYECRIFRLYNDILRSKIIVKGAKQ